MVLSKKFSLSKKKDFEAVYKKGKRTHGEFVTVITSKNEINISRFGVIVSNKVSKKATERNKIRRRISEIIRQNLGLLKKGLDVIIIAKIQILDKKYEDIESEILKLFKKQKILTG